MERKESNKKKYKLSAKYMSLTLKKTIMTAADDKYCIKQTILMKYHA